MSEKKVTILGWTGSTIAILMYFSYIDQIRLNIAGQSGSLILPFITALNGVIWVLYGLMKEKKDWPIVICNIPAIIFGIITFVTAILFR